MKGKEKRKGSNYNKSPQAATHNQHDLPQFLMR